MSAAHESPPPTDTGTPDGDERRTVDAPRLRRVLGDESLGWLVARVRTRLERGLSLDGAVTLSAATAEQRRAVGRLLGRPPRRGSTLRVSLPAVEDALRRGRLAPDLRAAVEALTGPVHDRAAQQAEAERAWVRALGSAESEISRRPELGPWGEWLRQTGIVRRLAEGDPARGQVLVEDSVAVLSLLPADGVPLSVLAARAVGDGHALDPGRPLATLVLRAAAELGRVPPGETAEERRTVWASVGVFDGELTNPVLALNLPGDPHTTTGQALTVWSAAGQPVHVSARQLVRDPPELGVRGRDIFVCENPAVVAAAADRLGAASAPLVCGSGHLGAAATLLLRILTANGARLHYHGDFDWPGLTIAGGVIDHFAAHPWRMTAEDYRIAAQHGGRPLRGWPVVVADWDEDLAPTMRDRGVAVEEETVLEALLHDLAGPGLAGR